jgi:hypothetical protein
MVLVLLLSRLSASLDGKNSFPSSASCWFIIQIWETYLQFHQLYRTTCTPRVIVRTPFTGEVLRRSLFETVPFNVRYYLSLSTALIPQLQLWQFRSLVSVQSLGKLHSQVLTMLQFRRDAATVSENHQRLNDVDQDNKTQIPLASVPGLILETTKINIMMHYPSCVYYVIIQTQQTVLCKVPSGHLTTHSNAMKENTATKCVTALNCDVRIEKRTSRVICCIKI